MTLATWLYEQFIHLTYNTLRSNVQLLSKCSMLNSLFSVTSWFDTVYDIVKLRVNFREHHLNEHEQQLSDYIFRFFLTEIYVFLVLFTFFSF